MELEAQRALIVGTVAVIVETQQRRIAVHHPPYLGPDLFVNQSQGAVRAKALFGPFTEFRIGRVQELEEKKMGRQLSLVIVEQSLAGILVEAVRPCRRS